MTSRLLTRRDTAANWVTNNPTLAQGEVGLETDTLKSKMGDGTTAWNLLVYSNPGSYQSTPTFATNAYTLVASDAGNILLASNSATAGTINIPTNATTPFPIKTQITIIQTGSGQITVQATTPGTTTVNSVGATSTAPKLRVQNAVCTLVKTGTDTWYVTGDVS